MDYLYKYMRDTFLKDCEVDDKMRKKEEILVEYFSKYLFTCISHHYSEQSFNLATTAYNHYLNNTPEDPLNPAFIINYIQKNRQEKPTGQISRQELFGEEWKDWL